MYKPGDILQNRPLTLHYVYALFDDVGIFYIGMTKDPANRLRDHIRGHRTQDPILRERLRGSSVKLEILTIWEDRRSAEQAEARTIRQNPGVLNVVHTSKMLTRSAPAPLAAWFLARKAG